MRKYLLPLWLFFTFSIAAQNTFPGGKIEVVKDFEVRLTETQKIRIVPQPNPIDSNVRKYEYRLLSASPAIEYQVPELKPLAIQSEKRPLNYPLFAKAGYGNPNSLLAMFSYDNVNKESFQWGVDLRHLSANNKKIPVQQFSNTGGRVNGAYRLGDHVWLKGYVDARIENIYFYGADPIPDNEESLKRKYTRTDIHLSIEKAYAPETSLNYTGFIRVLNDRDDLGSKEGGLMAGGDIHTRFSNDRFPIGLRVLADLSELEHTESHAVNNLMFTPYLGYGINAFQARLGATALLSNQKNEFLPEIQLSYPMGRSGLTLLAGWTGKVEKNNFRFLSGYNPYISTRLDILNNQVNRKIYAGIKSGAEKTSFEITGNYTRFTGMAFFLQDEDIPEQFVPVYDDGSWFGIEGSIRMEILKQVFLRAGLYQRFFAPDHEDKPWHRPSFGLNGEVSYAGNGDKYHVAFQFNGENGMPYLTLGGSEETLDPLIDLNLHGDYYFSSSFGFFAELNNLLSNKRERWVNYPSFGFNAKAGILFRLP